MYTATIGKLILQQWKEKHRCPDMSARMFFDEILFPIFFDDERYLMVANNSKFDQAYKQKKKKPLTAEVRQEALNNFHEAVDELTAHEAHIYLGGYSRSVEDPTTSQVTDLVIPLDSESSYLTWLGSAAGIGVKGGVSLLINDADILDQIVEGWHWYREYMVRTETLKPHQIDTWNGWWLTMRNDPFSYDPSDPLFEIPEGMVEYKNGVTSLKTVSWSHLLFSIARNRKEQDHLMAYVYSFGQTNTSIGFTPLLITQINKLPDIYKLIGGVSESKNQFQSLYETEFGFISACRMGAIGLKALEPKSLRNFVYEYRGKINSPKYETDNDKQNFLFFKTWIIAMLDNKTLERMARGLAQKLHNVGPAERGKTTLSTKVKSVLEATTQMKLVAAMTELLEDSDLKSQDNFDPGILQEVVSEVMQLPASKVPLFLTLVRFESAVLNFKS